jgi:hypothetical protein
LARYLLNAWSAALDGLPAGPVEVGQLAEAFAGIEAEGGEFRARLELAAMAIALKRRVIVLQAVEHSQADTANSFENFVRSLTADQRRVDQLKADISSVLVRLSSLDVRAPSRLLDKLMTRGQVVSS